jgi:hypothetical protein
MSRSDVSSQSIVDVDLIDTAYGMLAETAASSEFPDWKEMLNWSEPIAPDHPLTRKFPLAYLEQVLPEEVVPGITERYSVVQFCYPRPWAVLAPLNSCVTPDNPQRCSAISAADALDEVIYQINLVEDARRV